MNKQSNKQAFIRYRDVDQFVKQQREKRPFMRSSVVLLLFPAKVDHIVVTLPEKAAARGAHHVRVPPQSRLVERRTVHETAHTMMHELLASPPPFAALRYIGTGRGDAHRGDQVVRYGKWIHFVGVKLHAGQRQLRSDSQLFREPYWMSGNHLLSTNEALAMSDTKYRLILQAIVGFSQLGAEGKIVRLARNQLIA